ncbi:rod shape-determining protein MreD [Sandarakinorhabdus sp.]|uniref:rod shape-determining protein MreD n=1 Tax=Sandarakinorhabdus sp. TaxID=1916663 RepID=UPI0035691F9B
MIAANPPPALLMTPDERRRWLLSTWRYGVPALASVLLLVLMLAPLPLSVPAMPHLALMGVLVWAMLQPGLMPPWLAFCIGALADLLFGQPVGVNATLFAVATGVMRAAGRVFGRHGSLFDWLIVTGVLLGFALLTGPLMALAGRPTPVLPLLWQWLTSVAAWPLVVRLCAAIQRKLAASALLWRHG